MVHRTVRAAAQRCPPISHADDVAVYVVNLARPGVTADALELLSDHERQRASEFRLLSRSTQFVVCRAVIRLLLADEVGCDPGQLPLAETRLGRPYLACDSQTWNFSISHSRHLGLVAIRHDRQVGVDLQYPRLDYPWPRLITRFCRSEEARVALREFQERGDLALLERWVAKEALLKAVGYGLTYPPARIHLQREGSGWNCAGSLVATRRTRIIVLKSLGAIPAALALVD